MPETSEIMGCWFPRAVVPEMEEETPATTLEIRGLTCYVTKNISGAWLAYIDVTEFPELHNVYSDVVNEYLPFHGGCTFSTSTSRIRGLEFDGLRYLVGCDWCHGTSLTGVEDASFEDVRRNLEEAAEWIPVFRLNMIARGNGPSAAV